MPAKYSRRTHDEGSCSHIYNRGVGRKVIFNDKQDYEVFLNYLRDYLTAPQDSENIKKDFTVNGRVFRGTPHQPKNYFNKIELVAYSLMPNHFHLVLHQATKGSIEKFTKSLSIRYSIYFNKKYQRTGTLFEGPYKSIHIEDVSRLPYLIRFLHRGSICSSSPEYLGTRATSWVKPGTVLSFFDKTMGSYKDFTERDDTDQKDKAALEGITFESQGQHIETNDTLRDNDMPLVDRDTKPTPNVPAFLAVSISVFLLLVGFGVKNIKASENNSPELVSIPLMLSKISDINKTIATPIPLVLSEQSEIDEVAPTPTPEAEETKSKSALRIKINDGSESVNIRQKPTTNSEKIGQAEDGDVFEIVSKNMGWYEIKLANGSVGFISPKYVEVINGP